MEPVVTQQLQVPWRCRSQIRLRAHRIWYPALNSQLQPPSLKTSVNLRRWGLDRRTGNIAADAVRRVDSATDPGWRCPVLRFKFVLQGSVAGRTRLTASAAMFPVRRSRPHRRRITEVLSDGGWSCELRLDTKFVRCEGEFGFGISKEPKLLRDDWLHRLSPGHGQSFTELFVS